MSFSRATALSRLPLVATRSKASFSTSSSEPIKIAVTGPAGAIGYSLVFRIASGGLFGNRPVRLQLLELPHAMNALKGVVMELDDCAFPALHSIVQTDKAEEAFADADVAFLVGAKPRGPGMERSDLLKDNGAIFKATGKALSDNAKSSVKVLIVGNPANTNTLICAANAPRIPKENFSAMMRLDHNRALAQLAAKTHSRVTDIQKLVIWGNHSTTQYPDVSHALIKGKAAKQVINDDAWIKDKFMPTVQKRGAEIIAARGASSAASAASAAIDHMRDWVVGSNGNWVSMAVPSDGSYGVEEGLYFGYPTHVDSNGKYHIEKNLPIDSFSAQCIEKTKKELLEERDAVKHLL